jgi:hypothetical protein
VDARARALLQTGPLRKHTHTLLKNATFYSVVNTIFLNNSGVCGGIGATIEKGCEPAHEHRN